MIVPLNVNLDMALRLKKCLRNFPHELKLAETILISSNIVLLHAHDLLDQRLIEKGTFVANFQDGDVVEALQEIMSHPAWFDPKYFCLNRVRLIK